MKAVFPKKTVSYKGAVYPPGTAFVIAPGDKAEIVAAGGFIQEPPAAEPKKPRKSR